tara:strand:- start:203 stop:571 length:369 start_codon:yes stop_codon:yes gene_type:complete
MALQVTKTNENGLTVSYWRVKNVELNYDSTWTAAPSGQMCRFIVEGYHNQTYRNNGRGVENHQYTVTGDHYTNIMNGTSGDLRPAVYDWLKSGSAAWETGSSYGNQGATKLDWDFFTTATDV